MAFDELAQKLFGAKRAESNAVLTDATTGTIHGRALTDSADGSVLIEVTGDVTTPDEVDIGGEHYYADAGVGIEVPTSESVKAGDEVLVSVYGEGTLRSPAVTSAIGSGDRVAAKADEAWTKADSVEGIAQQALDVANATGQHFWDDTNGAHVTELPREEWEAQQTGPNSLWNSLGMLFRNGLKNLLAVLTSGIAIYDGEGNDADNILAEFSASNINIGRSFADDGLTQASVGFFDGDTLLDAQHYVTGGSTYQDLYLSTKLEGEAAGQDVRSSLGTHLETAAEAGHTYDRAETGMTAAAAPQGMSAAELSVSAGYDGKTLTRLLSAKADNVFLTSLQSQSAQGVSWNGTMAHVIDVLNKALPVTLFTGTYSETVNSSVTLSESAANFSRLRIEWEAGDGYRGSTELSNPNGAKFMCSGMVSGSGTNPTTFVTWKIYEVSGTKILNWKRSNAFQRGQINIYNSGNPTTNRNELIGITRVLGWR